MLSTGVASPVAIMHRAYTYDPLCSLDRAALQRRQQFAYTTRDVVSDIHTTRENCSKKIHIVLLYYRGFILQRVIGESICIRWSINHTGGLNHKSVHTFLKPILVKTLNSRKSNNTGFKIVAYISFNDSYIIKEQLIINQSSGNVNCNQFY